MVEGGKQMRISFDATAILGPLSKNRGIGNYSLSLLITTIEMDRNNEYYFFNLFDEEFSLNDYLQNGAAVKEFQMYSGPDGFLLKERKYNEVMGKLVKKYITENSIDIFCITSPFDDHNVVYKKEWFGDCKVVAITYDIIPYVMKDHYLTEPNYYKYYMECVNILRWADGIQVISQSVMDDLVNYLNFDKDKISVIWGAVDKRYGEIEINGAEKKQLYDKFGINSAYVMCTGGDDDRKNIAGLIEAYSKLPRSVIDTYQLVIVCKLSQPSFERYTELAVRLNVKDRVILTNFVSERELLIFYNLATLMAFPSLYEGFGLPVVEAWACGTPVLTSDNSSLVQIADGAAVIVDARSIDDITRGMKYALTECDLEDLTKKGKKRLELFQWKEVAKKSIASFEKLKDSIENIEPSVANDSIAFFAPLPPIKSGISDYSVDIIKALYNYYQIDVYIDEGYKPDVVFDDRIQILPHKEFEKNRNKYKEIIYQVGNSEYHIYMFRYIQKYKGVVVLHDYNMHGVLLYYSLEKGKLNYSTYEKILKEDYADQQVGFYVEQLKTGKTGYKNWEWELNGFISNYAKRIIVHSFEAKEKLLKKNIKQNVKRIWHYADTQMNKINRAEFKEKAGYSDSIVLFSAFGHIHETKRPIPILKAFKKVTEENPNARLVFVGKMSDDTEQQFETVLEKFNLRAYVKVTGYTTLEDFDNYISITDVCLNLRYPYNGETSGSMMRNLVQGNAVVVNGIGSFNELPDHVCIKLPNVMTMSPVDEIEQIYNAMKGIFEMPEEYQKLRENAKRFAKEELDVKIIARQYRDFIEAEQDTTVNEGFLKDLSQAIADWNLSQRQLMLLSKTIGWIKESTESQTLK